VKARFLTCFAVAFSALLIATAACGKPAQNGEPAESPAGETGPHSEETHAEPGRLTLTEAQYATAAIAVEAAAMEPMIAEGADLDVPGQVEHDPRRVAIISSRTPGRIEALSFVEGERVASGQTVALLSSPTFLTAQNDLAQAARRAKSLAGTSDAEGAQALVAAARRRLALLGAGLSSIRRIEEGAEPNLFLPITAPFSGSIVEATALVGSAVEAGVPLFKIADVSVVDVVAEVPERAISLLRIGLGASIEIAAFPNLRFAGRVERLHSELNPTTRTVRAVIHVSNTGSVLRPGMFATVRFPVSMAAALGTERTPGDAPTSPANSVMTVPETAIVSEGPERIVFVEIGPRTFEKRVVQVSSLAPPGSGNSSSGRVAISGGLRTGERVVTRGAFTLKSELAKASFSDEH
jgi:cobalt-zinc-cadmium efflux system membrane fusion protein